MHATQSAHESSRLNYWFAQGASDYRQSRESMASLLAVADSAAALAYTNGRLAAKRELLTRAGVAELVNA